MLEAIADRQLAVVAGAGGMFDSPLMWLGAPLLLWAELAPYNRPTTAPAPQPRPAPQHRAPGRPLSLDPKAYRK